MTDVIQFRVTASQDKTQTLINELESSPMISRVEEIADLQVGVPDDSSSAELPDDQGPGTHHVELEFESTFDEGRVRDLVALKAGSKGMGLEFLERSGDERGIERGRTIR